ncbi:hypothetical protein HYPSUDRAFT_69421 [Hypholoma sublateritium FD-334 SS-4]|uniref:Endonuclease III homolog n=1 Tax=Hypholoma sublateritium (strain FD-334 SS-4) TaxID=945553 RepID=A0A0D2PG33_HYPSF|nr:hypothetical protein HYPSUDRAFT_69421 [Hypholoma sublateritium FD-334 SS-4]
MSATKRTASARSPTNLTSRVSVFNSQVTLFEAADDPDDTPRRSKRAKKEVKREDSILEDVEDLEYTPSASTPTPRKRKAAVKSEPKQKKAASKSSPAKRAATSESPKKAKPIPQVLSTPHPEPPNWRETYNTIKEMRARFIAPVDTMGCQRAQLEETEPRNKRYSTLVALQLSSSTKDEVMHAAVIKLRKALGGSITIEGMIAADEEVIHEAIKTVGYHNKKHGYLKNAAIMLRDKFDSDVPDTVDKLCALPGVGPKMAFLTLQVAWNITDGIGVDVHVHRITNLLGWHKPPTKSPEQTRLNLQSWLPKELYADINHMMVGFGQVICVPASPRCDECALSKKRLCPSARVVDGKNRKAIVYLETKESPPEVEIALEEAEEETYMPKS